MVCLDAAFNWFTNDITWTHGCSIGLGAMVAVSGVEPCLLYLLDLVLSDVLCIADFGLPASAVFFGGFFLYYTS